MNVPDQTHFDQLDPGDFEFQNGLRAAKSENLCEVSTLIEERLQAEKGELVYLLRASLGEYDLALVYQRLQKGKVLIEATRDRLCARFQNRTGCERRGFKIEASFSFLPTLDGALEEEPHVKWKFLVISVTIARIVHLSDDEK